MISEASLNEFLKELKFVFEQNNKIIINKFVFWKIVKNGIKMFDCPSLE